MTKKDINDIISIICPNDEDFEKTCISPAYLKKELEVLALEQEPVLDNIKDRACFAECEVLPDGRVVIDLETIYAENPKESE